MPRFLAKHSLWRVPVLGQRAARQPSRSRSTATRPTPSRACAPRTTALQRRARSWSSTRRARSPATPTAGRCSAAPASPGWRCPPTSRWCRWCTGAPARCSTATSSGSARCRASRSPCAAASRSTCPAYRGRPIDAELLREVTDLIMAGCASCSPRSAASRRPAGFYPRAGGAVVTRRDPPGRGARRRLLGHDVRQGAGRRRPRGAAVGPAAPRWPPAINDGHANPDYLPGVTLPAHARGDHRRARPRWTAPTRWCSPCRRRRCGPTSTGWRELLPPGALLVSLAKGVELGTLSADERGGRRGRRGGPGPGRRACPGPTWPGRSPPRSRPPP